jgi:uncharacterized protein (TIGR02145 family)
MTTIKNLINFCLCLFICFAFACKKDKAPAITVPELTTTAISSITSNTAMSGGTITSNGGETITVSGICWSTTNQNPTISDDTTKSNTASGSFTAMLTGLNSSSTYYVRAYAINRIGTGYGNAVTFTTGNGAPTATSVTITGDGVAGAELTAAYSYSDPESDPESGSTFKWYVANDAAGAGEVEISGATALTYTIEDDQAGKYIRFGVTPKSSAGNTTGTEVKSAFIGAIGEATTVTFTYDGQEVTYGIINSTTGKKWMDRNLGANRAAQSATDYLAYGDLFQWGRLADGHQKIAHTNGTDAGATGVTGVNATTSADDVPPTNKFITTTSLTGDWRIPQNSNLWQGVDGVNNPCPTGWRIPSEAEWIAEGITDMGQAYTKLKITSSGARDLTNGSFNSMGSVGWYWTSTVDPTDATYSIVVGIDATSFFSFGNNRAYGFTCRCIKQ